MSRPTKVMGHNGVDVGIILCYEHMVHVHLMLSPRLIAVTP